MSTLRRIIASRANGALSRGPSTPLAKQHSAQNARRHGLLARCTVLDDESREAFDALMEQHIERFQPADGIELGMVEEMVAATWRQRRSIAMETRMIQNQVSAQPVGGGDDPLDRIAKAFSDLATSPGLALLHRYETRLHLMYQRSVQTLLLLRLASVPNEPSPDSEQSGDLTAPPEPPSPGRGLMMLALRTPRVPYEPSPVSEHYSVFQRWLLIAEKEAEHIRKHCRNSTKENSG